MHDPVFEEDHCGCKIKIFQDDASMSPRDWDTLGKMVCWHRRYELGDPHSFENPDAFFADVVETAIASNTDTCAVRSWIANKMSAKDAAAISVVMLPLYLYDHTGISMNTKGFHCPWDSGQVGFIYASNDQIRKEYGVSKITADIRNRVIETLECEVASYSAFLEGCVYGFIVTRDGEEIGSCWGFIGDYEDECLSEARATASSTDNLCSDEMLLLAS